MRGFIVTCVIVPILVLSCTNVPQDAEHILNFRDEIIYFLLTDRFSNGNPANDDGLSRPAAFDEADVSNPVGWHGGDFAGITQKIREGYFQDLGMTAIWISPPYAQAPGFLIRDGQSPNNGKPFSGFHGYWADDLHAPFDAHFGTAEEYQELIATAHEQGLKIVQDLVVNHLGSQASFYEGLSDAKRLAWFNEEHEEGYGQDDIRVRLFGLPDLDQRNKRVVRYLDASIATYVDAGIDAIRMDTIKHVEPEYWHHLFSAGAVGDPSHVWTVGEAYLFGVEDQMVLAEYMDMGFPSVLDFPLKNALVTTIAQGGSLDELTRVIDRDGLYTDPTMLSTFLDNHDMPRFISETIAARGEPGARERLIMAITALYYFRGIPIVYYGTELAMPGKGDSYGYALGESSREDMRFHEEDAELKTVLRNLAQIRTEKKTLRYGKQISLLRPSQVGGRDIAFFLRYLAGEAPILIAINNEDTEQALPPTSFPLSGEGLLSDLLGSSHSLEIDNGTISGNIPPRSVLGFELDATVNVQNLSFRVDAHSQGDAPIALLVYEYGQEFSYPMKNAGQGIWELQLPRLGTGEVLYSYKNTLAQTEENLSKPRQYQIEAADDEEVYGFPSYNLPRYFLEGRITTEEGQVLAGAKVYDARNAQYAAFSNAEGFYRLPLPSPAPGAIHAEYPGYQQMTLRSERGRSLDFVLSSATGDADYVLRDDPEERLLWGSKNDLRSILCNVDENGIEFIVEYVSETQNALMLFIDAVDDPQTGILDAAELSQGAQLARFPSEHRIDYIFVRRGAEPLKAYNSETTTLSELDGQLTMSAGAENLQFSLPWELLGIDYAQGGRLHLFAGIFGGEGYGGGDVAPDADADVITISQDYAIVFQEPFVIQF